MKTNKDGRVFLLPFVFTLLSAIFLLSFQCVRYAKANSGEIIWNPDEKAVYISGDVTDSEIVKSRLEGPSAWSQEVEHIYIEKGTHISFVRSSADINQDYASLFGGYTKEYIPSVPKDANCPHLKTLISGENVTCFAQTTDGLELGGMILYDTELEVVSLPGWDIHNLSNLSLMLSPYAPSLKPPLPVACKSLPSIEILNWTFPVDDYDILSPYFSEVIFNGSNAPFISPYSEYTAGICPSYTISDYKSEGGSTEIIPAGPEGPTRWRAVVDSIKGTNDIYYMNVREPEDEYKNVIKHSVAFLSADFSSAKLTSGSFGEALTVPTNADKDGKQFLGWSTTPNATVPELTPQQTKNLPQYGRSPLVYYPVYGSASSWEQDEHGWRYVSDGTYATGWRWIDDTYGAHWYYFNEDTYMAASQWQWDEGYSSWYWLCSSGPMIRGLWQWIDNEWYGFWWNGKMCRGWVWDADWQTWFYCYNNGIMARNTWEGPYWLNWRGIWSR